MSGSPIDVLSRSLRDAQEQEYLDPAEERELIRGWQERRDPACRDKIINAHMRLAIAYARKRGKSSEDIVDLINDSVIAMMIALDKYQDGHNARFATYAKWWMKDASSDTLALRYPVNIRTNLLYSFIKQQRELLAKNPNMNTGEIVVSMAKEMKTLLMPIWRQCNPKSFGWLWKNFGRKISAAITSSISAI